MSSLYKPVLISVFEEKQVRFFNMHTELVICEAGQVLRIHDQFKNNDVRTIQFMLFEILSEKKLENR